jgi:hypothetical protein
MNGMPIELVKEALQLFMQCLPNGCTFKIISFGSGFDSLAIEGNEDKMIPYLDSTKKSAIDQIGDFSANYGGTEIHNPTKHAFETKVGTNVEKRVFLLTDGFSDNKEELLESIKDYCEVNKHTKVFSFGISDECDKEMVKNCAEYGNGSYQLIGDQEMSIIKEKVMLSLKRASVPSMQDCSFDFGNGQEKGFRNDELYLGHMRQLGTLYQNEIVRIFAIMTEEEFAKMNCVFDCKHNPVTKEPMTQKIDLSKFNEANFEDHSFLFKLAA